jgi:chromosomal replication initiator protein
VDFSEEIFVLAVENNHWEAIKHQLHDKLTPEAFQNWIARTSLLAHEGSALRVMVPDDVTRLWLEHEYAPRVQTAIKELNLPVARVHYEVARNGTVAVTHEPRAVREVNPPARFEPAERQLNHKLAFDSFVVGSCNQFAHAAASAVAAQPAKVYNPLFIYGGSGMGKTHLLHAIGLDLLARYPDLRLVYTSGERFVNETVSSIRTQRMDDFHAHYRTADVLLVDDVHILAEKSGRRRSSSILSTSCTTTRSRL